MTKVIKGEFEKLEDLNDKDVSLACDTSLEVFNNEFNRMSGMDDDLFTYEVEVANIPCDSNKDDDSEQRVSHEANDDMGYDPSDVASIIHWSDKEEETAKIFKIETDVFDYETPLCLAFNEFNYLLKVDPDLLTKDIIGFKTFKDYKDDWIYEWDENVFFSKTIMIKHGLLWEFGRNRNQSTYCKPFNYKNGCQNGQPSSSDRDVIVMEENFLGLSYGNSLYYQEIEWLRGSRRLRN
ncbi:hypothetical protein Tco_1318791 [Tanacetum coccineum]